MPYHYHYRKIRKNIIKKQAKLYLFIMVTCFFAAAGIYAVTETVPNFIQKSVILFRWLPYAASLSKNFAG